MASLPPTPLLIDEVGFDRLEQESARNASLFFKVIDQRYCKASTLLTTNIDFKVMISTASSGSFSHFKILASPLSVTAIG